MFAQITRLQYWKSEHDEQTCEDAYGDDTSHSLFALADGAGTTLFSNIWAGVIVQHFLRVPLLSCEPFEVEWWVRQAQEQYKHLAPESGGLQWNALQKAQNQGSHSTLVALRFSSVDSARCEAELLAFGDSCALIVKADDETLQSFPLEKASDFEQAPICIPSKLNIFNRYFHRCHTTSVALNAGDSIMLATDAVAKWVISAGNSRYHQPVQAFREIAAQTPATWATFIQECRDRKEMVDDDSTAMMITLNAGESADTYPLQATTEHTAAVRQDRKADFARALEADNKELLAISFGDGVDLRLEGVTLPVDEVAHARQVADAMREILQGLRQAVNSPNAAAVMGKLWQNAAPLLLHEPCAENLRRTLAQLGVPVASPAPLQPPPATGAADASLPAEAGEGEAENMPAEGPEDQLYTGVITLTPEDMARFGAVQQTGFPKLQDVLSSKSMEQMAALYRDEIKGTPVELNLPTRDVQLLKLAYAFREAYAAGNDEAIITAFENVQRSPYYADIELTPEEEERVSRVWMQNMALIAPARAEVAPTISEAWFRKVCSVKWAYLFCNLHLQFAPEQLERMALDDLVNDYFIQKGIEEVNQRGSDALTVSDARLNDALASLKDCRSIDYAELLRRSQLTDDEVRAALLVFLRQKLFEEYLHRQEATSLHDWLVRHKQAPMEVMQPVSQGQPAKQERSWLSKFVWWKGA